MARVDCLVIIPYDLREHRVPWYYLPTVGYGYWDVSHMPFIPGGDRYQVMFAVLDDMVAPDSEARVIAGVELSFQSVDGTKVRASNAQRSQLHTVQARR